MSDLQTWLLVLAAVVWVLASVTHACASRAYWRAAGEYQLATAVYQQTLDKYATLIAMERERGRQEKQPDRRGAKQ